MIVSRVSLPKCILLCFSLLLVSQLAIAQAPPNIIVFIADDLGWEDTSPYGNRVVRTPNIARLAREGIRFDNFFLTASSCSPGRFSMLTGLYPHNTGAMNLHENLEPETEIFPTLLKEVGYYTMLVGKSHGTNHPEVQKKFDVLNKANRSKPWTMGEMWLEALEERSKDQPFFLWAASIDLHRPYQQGYYDYHHQLEDVILPPYYPDIPEMREELAAYYDEISLRINGEEVEQPKMVKGYVTVRRKWQKDDAITLTFNMPVRRVYSQESIPKRRNSRIRLIPMDRSTRYPQPFLTNASPTLQL